MEEVKIPWGGDERLPLSIPPGWRVVAQGEASARERFQDLAGAIRERLDQPVGSPPLRELVKPDSKIALIMDDPGRPTPVHKLAAPVLDYLLEAGARPENVTGLFAIGTHAMMSDQEMRARAGESVAGRIELRCFDCNDQSAFVRLGRTGRGTEVMLNRLAVEADLRVLIGTIEAHPQAGFGGGYKNILPGLAAGKSIGHNHLITPSPEAYNMIGTLPEENPMRLDLEEAGRMIKGPTFILNSILDPGLAPVALVAGDAVKAHREGVRLSREMYGVRLPGKADVVIASAYPMDQDLRQAGKAVLNVAGACRPGGVIVVFMRCEQGLGNVGLPRFAAPLSLVRGVTKLLGSRGIFFISSHLPSAVPVEARFLVNMGLQMMKDSQVLLFSPRLKEVAADRFPPVLFDDQRSLFAEAGRLTGKDAPEVAVIHQGGVSFPVFSGP